jgi:RNA polymerase sigma factor (sigma-70 family)
MPGGDSATVLRRVEVLFRDGTVAGLSDGQLLDRFVAGRDESAFEALVARHGPMVLSLCRRLLRDPHDGEEAFQAAFLVLARKADSIRDRDRVGPWLYRVAHRVAARLRAREARRRSTEGQAARGAEQAPAEPGGDEVGAALHDEVGRLPESYRAPIVLCYLEGLTHDQAARQLRWPVGTVRGRLARARDLLRSRLTRRGLALSAGWSLSSLCEGEALAALPPGLAAATAAAALGVRAGGIAVGRPAAAATLAEEVLRTMLLSKLKLMAVVAGGVALGAGLVAYGAAGSSQDEAPRPSQTPRAAGTPAPPGSPADLDRSIGELTRQAGQHRRELDRIETELRRLRALRPGRRPMHDQAPDAPTPAATRPARSSSPRYVVEPPDMLIVEVLEALPARPITGERLVRPDGTISLGFYGDIDVAGLTLAEIKKKVILHMRNYLRDATLGLAMPDPNDPDKEVIPQPDFEHPLPPEEAFERAIRESNRVFVDVAAYNSKAYYVEGDVAHPGRFPSTGGDTVLDAINYAGGLTPTADPASMRLVRQAPRGGGKGQVFRVDYEAIVKEGDPATNYQLMPGDRLSVDRRPMPADRGEAAKGTDASPTTAARLSDLERKMDQVLMQLRALRREPNR